MRSRMSDCSRQRLRTIITVLATALVIAPAAALATHGFTDVDDGDFYHAAVDWMKDNGVTVGCNPPSNTRYCPDLPVTRGEMAVFLERLDSKNVFLRPGEVKLDGGDADTLDGIDSQDFATDAELAGFNAFVPVATISVTNGAIDHANFRDPVSSMPTISGTDGQFTIDLPGVVFAINDGDMAVCSGHIRNLNVSVLDSSGGDLRVDLYESDGTLADSAFSEDDFACVVYAGT